MILQKEFYNWLVSSKSLKSTVATTNVKRILRIDDIYDVSDAYDKDRCAYLLSLFDYSMYDMDQGFLPGHDIVINGNYYTGTQSLKYALKRYVEFMDDYYGVVSYDVTDEEVDELLELLRQLEPETKSIQEMLDEIRDGDEVCRELPVVPTDDEPTVFMGSFQSFLRFVGPFCKNYVNSITRSPRKKHGGICEYCGKKAVLDSAHKDGEDRPIIIKKILDTYFKKSSNYYEVDINKFEKLFKNAHLPVEDHIFFLCKTCHGEYDRGTAISTADILAKRSAAKVSTD